MRRVRTVAMGRLCRHQLSCRRSTTRSACQPRWPICTGWLSSSNALLTANASRASINCAAKSWSLAEWQATGRDQGSWTGPLPSVEALEQQARELLAGAG
jgi:hypothetical protein